MNGSFREPRRRPGRGPNGSLGPIAKGGRRRSGGLDITYSNSFFGRIGFATGAIGGARRVERAGVELVATSHGDGAAGSIQLKARSPHPKGRHSYRVEVNGNHPPATRFVTLAHELAHLFLGHLGADRGRDVPDRSRRDHALREVEAETVGYLVARRNGVTPRSETYLDAFKGSFDDLEHHAVMRAVNQIERAFGIDADAFWKAKEAPK